MHPSAISSQLISSGLRPPQPSPMRVSHTARPNSDDNDDDDDDARLTRSQSRGTSSAEADNHQDRGFDEPSARASSSQPKTDNPSVPIAAGARTGTGNVPFSLSLTLRNTGSVARDHLASERTFLAYVRTSLSFASAGVGLSSHPSYTSLYPALSNTHIALVQLFRVSVSTSSNSASASHDQPVVASYARPLGATLIAFGMAVLVIGEFSLFSFFIFSPFLSYL